MSEANAIGTAPFSWPSARQAGDFVFVGGQTPHDRRTGKLILDMDDLAPQDRTLLPVLFTRVVSGRLRAQVRQVLENLKAALESAGSSIEHVAHLRVFVLDLGHEGTVLEILSSFFGDRVPSGEIVQARNPGSHPDILIQVDCTAVSVAAGKPDHIWIKGMEALSQPFPTVTKAGGLLFTSQFAGAHANTGEAYMHARELGDRGRSLLGGLAARASRGTMPFFVQQAAMWDHFLTVLQELGIPASATLYHMNWMRQSMTVFADGSVTRSIMSHTGNYLLTCFPVAGVRTPNAEIEGRIIAVLPESGLKKDVRVPIHGISNSYFGMIKVGPYLFAAGEVPIDTEATRLINCADALNAPANLLGFGRPYREGEIRVQAHYIYTLYERTLAAYGSNLSQAVHQTAYLTDGFDGPAFEGVVWGRMSGGVPPTTIVPILGASPFSGTRLELELTAYVGN